MSKHAMITYGLAVCIVDSPAEAPKYSGEEFTMIKLKTAVIVGNGTQQGNPTVDLQAVDGEGKKYLVMTTGSLIEMIGGMAKTKREQDSGDTNGNHN